MQLLVGGWGVLSFYRTSWTVPSEKLDFQQFCFRAEARVEKKRSRTPHAKCYDRKHDPSETKASN